MTRRKALTIWQPWASLIMLGHKPIEFRTWAAPKSIVGQRIVIHAGAKFPRDGVRDLLFDSSGERIRSSCGPMANVAAIRELLEGVAFGGYHMMTGVGLGTAVLGQPERADNHYRRHGWPTGEGPWNIAWPLSDIEAWEEPVPMRGAQGLWEWPA